MLAAQRRSRILTELDLDGTVKVSQLVTALGVSDMTVRRDLKVLEEQGMLVRVHGGAVVRREPATSEPGFAVKSELHLAEKEAIGAHAVTLVRPGTAIAVSAGTTTHLFARHLIDIPGLTVVTNSVWVADVLHRFGGEGTSVLLTGGLRTPSDALVGPLSIAALTSLHLDAAFLGVHGMDERAGFSTPNLLEAETNRAMVSSARQLMVLADSSKWGVVGLSTMAQLSEADVVITDNALPETGLQALTEAVEDVVVVDPARLVNRMGIPASD